MRIFVTRRVPLWDEVSKPLLDFGHEVTVYAKNKPIEREELEKELEKGYDGLLTLLNDKIDEDLLKHDVNKQLKVIANYTVGYDNVNLEACGQRNIKVSNAPSDEVNESVAEFTWAMILAMARRINEAGEFMQNAAYKGWDPEVFLGSWVMGKTLGLAGMGRIGGMVAKRAAGFGMKVIYYNRKPATGVDFEYRPSLDELIAESDYVSLHVPLTYETTHLINKNNLPKFKKSAFLINTARGPVVDETEVVEALRAGFLAGYAADVFENEPDPHPELLQMENVMLTPHIASATVEARRAMGRVAVENLLAGLAGKDLPNQVGK